MTTKPELNGAATMRAILCATLLSMATTTAGAAESARQPTAAPNTTSVTRKLQNHWSECLNSSYRTASTRTPDKNMAAEIAFTACTSEEADLASFVNAGVPRAYSPMPHLRAEVKRMLVNGERLPIYPER